MAKSTPAQLADYFSVDELAVEDVGENYNVSPTQHVLAVTEREARRRLDAYHWGLIPSWAKDRKVGYRMINARAETVAERPAYKRAFARRRCIIPADGFYEWKRRPGEKRKQPYYIRPVDEPVFAFAGLWELWRDPDDPDAEPVRSCTILTTDANEKVTEVHDRMPVVLPQEAWSRWLDLEADVDALRRLLVPAPAGSVELHPVSTRVNNPQNNDPSLVKPER